MKDKYKDHEVVEKAEVWWKKKSKMAQAIFVIAAVLIVYNFFLG